MIGQILTSCGKELLLLKRDRTGLLMLFAMPAILVIVITLVQENVLELTGQKETQLALLDLDGGELGKSLRAKLALARFEVVDWPQEGQAEALLQAGIEAGDYRLGLILPAGASDRVRQQAAIGLDRVGLTLPEEGQEPVPVSIHFDPGILPGFRSGLLAQLQLAFATVGLEQRLAVLGRELQLLMPPLDGTGESASGPVEALTEQLGQPLFQLESGNGGGEVSNYRPVEQNVSAWALFGMFFTAIPIAGTVLQERRSGIWIRLRSLPVAHLLLFCGKVLAFIGVCVGQFLLVGLIGATLFPVLGLPAFVPSQGLAPLLATILLSSLAACGLGILLGMACASYQQAAALGATIVVAGAAIGGVMVPVYAMPLAMQKLSLISPLNWGLTALQDVLLRGASLADVLDELSRLLLFFLLTTLLAWRLAQLRE